MHGRLVGPECAALGMTRQLESNRALLRHTLQLRSMTPAGKRLLIANDLFILAFRTKKEQLRKKHPEKTERELNHMAYALIERGCTR